MNETALRKLLAQRFIQRTDVKAVQDTNGYHPDKTKFTAQDVLDHLHGKRALGHYLLDTENKCKLFAFDIDLVKDKRSVLDSWTEAREIAILQMNALAEGLGRRAHKLTGCHVAAAFSGNKGVHVYCFTGTEAAEDVKQAALEVINSFGCFDATRGNNFYKHTDEYQDFEIEVFPKQTEVSEDGFGNLMRLPLGKNRKSGKPAFFLKFIPPMTEFTEMDPMVALEGELPWVS